MERRNLNNLLAVTAKQFAHRCAVLDNGRALSYQQIDLESNAVANFLRQQGIDNNARVLISMENCTEFIVIYWGVIKASCTAVLVNPHNDDDVMMDISSNASPSVIFALKHSILISSEERAKNHSVASNHYLCRFLDSPHTLHNMNDVFSCSSQPCLPMVGDQDVATIIYTSGSSGLPKGVVLTHDSMFAAIEAIAAYLPYRDDDILLCSLPLSFDYGLYQMLLIFRLGAQLVLEGNCFWPYRVLNLIENCQITVFPMLPKMIDLLVDASRDQALQFGKVKLLSFTGDKLHPHHVEKLNTLFPRAQIYAMYGLTECKRCTYIPPQYLLEKIHSVGIAIPGTELWIEDEKGNVLPPGMRGELVVKSLRNMHSYWNNSRQTDKKLKFSHKAGAICLYTGDYCSIDEDDYVYYHGRIDDLILLNNSILCLTDLERALYASLDLKEVSLLQNHTGENLYIDCFIVLQSDKNINIYTRQIQQLFFQYNLSYSLYQLDFLPRTLNGKTDKKALSQNYRKEIFMITNKCREYDVVN